MKRSLRTFVAAVLVAVPLLASCNEVQAPVTASAGSSIDRQDGLITDLLGGLINIVGSILSGPDANGEAASAWIGSEGGTVKTAAYTLTVPRGAVSTKTRFVVEPLNNGTYVVELHAYVKGLLGEVDVGSKGFQKPVLLTISYANADGITNERKLAIVYVVSSTEGEIQATNVDRKDKDVTAQLPHFSKYAMVQN